MSEIRWGNLRHISGLNLDILEQLEARQHHADQDKDGTK